MKRVRIEVLPVDCSPRNTTFNFDFKLLIYYNKNKVLGRLANEAEMKVGERGK